MTVVVRSSADDVIAMPAAVLADLDLHEGDDVMLVVNGKVVCFARPDSSSDVRELLSEDEDRDDGRL